MFVYINGPQWFVLSFGVFLASCLVVAVSILYVIRKKKVLNNISEVDTKLLPTPAKIRERTAAQIGEGPDMSLTDLNCVPRFSAAQVSIGSLAPKPTKLVRLPDTPLPPAVMWEQPRIVRVEKFGVWLTAFDQFNRHMPAYSGPMHSVGAKIFAAGFHDDFQEVDSASAVFNKQLIDRMIDIREISPIK